MLLGDPGQQWSMVRRQRAERQPLNSLYLWWLTGVVRTPSGLHRSALDPVRSRVVDVLEMLEMLEMPGKMGWL